MKVGSTIVLEYDSLARTVRVHTVHTGPTPGQLSGVLNLYADGFSEPLKDLSLESLMTACEQAHERAADALRKEQERSLR